MLYILSLLIFFNTYKCIKRIILIDRRPVRLIYYQIIYNCFIKFLQGYLGFPAVFNYVTDIILLFILMYYILERHRWKAAPIPGSLMLVFLIYLTMTLCSYVLNRYSPLIYFWGVRNNMRFIFFAMMCVVYLTMEDIEAMLDMLFGYFILNILAVTYEYFFAGLTFHTGDYISGLYSLRTTLGGNGSLNWLMIIICTNAIIKYLNKSISFSRFLFTMAGALYMAALSELKVFFVVLVFVAILTIIVSKKSIKIVSVAICGIVLLVASIYVFYKAFPQYQGYFNLSDLISRLFTNEGYGGVDSMSRSNALEYVFYKFLPQWPERIFGIGLGNADYSGFKILVSEFYKRYSSTAYQWFYGPFILIELGIMGFLAYLGFYVNFLRQNIKVKSTDLKVANMKRLSLTIICLAVVMLFYDQSLKTETVGYMIFMFMSVPYIIRKRSWTEI